MRGVLFESSRCISGVHHGNGVASGDGDDDGDDDGGAAGDNDAGGADVLVTGRADVDVGVSLVEVSVYMATTYSCRAVSALFIYATL